MFDAGRSRRAGFLARARQCAWACTRARAATQRATPPAGGVGATTCRAWAAEGKEVAVRGCRGRPFGRKRRLPAPSTPRTRARARRIVTARSRLRTRSLWSARARRLPRGVGKHIARSPGVDAPRPLPRPRAPLAYHAVRHQRRGGAPGFRARAGGRRMQICP